MHDASPPPAATLDDLHVGETATLRVPSSLHGTTLRLMEMGMTPGETVTVTRRAPLGDPIEVFVKGTRLCLRSTDARAFCVVRNGAPLQTKLHAPAAVAG